MLSAKRVAIMVIGIALILFTSGLIADQLVTRCVGTPFVGALIASGGLICSLAVLLVGIIVFLGQSFETRRLPPQ